MSAARGGAGADPVEVLLHRLDEGLPVPGYAHPGDAGVDLMTTIDVTLAPGARETVPTGIAIALPAGYAAFVHPRSGLAARSGVTLVNAPGTVDAGYRGEIRVTLLNTDQAVPVHLRRGDRIAQLVVQRVSQARFVEVQRLPGSARGSGGFGSTGGFGPAGELGAATELGKVATVATGESSVSGSVLPVGGASSTPAREQGDV
jgi:dUTP pyrophosphatase